MNIVDLLILGIIGVSVLFGMYKGFINAIFGLFGVIAALIIACIAYPALARSLQGNESLVRTLIHYSDASSRIHDLELSQTPVAGISEQTLTEILTRADLPEPLGDFVRENIVKGVFASLGSVNVSEYLNQTIVAVSFNILCFLLCFAGAYAAIMLLVHLLGYVFRLPVLKHLDLLLGGLFGGVRGVFLVFVFFLVVPVLRTVSPIDQVSEAIAQSQLAAIFNKSGLIELIMRGSLL